MESRLLRPKVLETMLIEGEAPVSAFDCERIDRLAIAGDIRATTLNQRNRKQTDHMVFIEVKGKAAGVKTVTISKTQI